MAVIIFPTAKTTRQTLIRATLLLLCGALLSSCQSIQPQSSVLIQLKSDLHDREFWLNRPESKQNEPLPLLIALNDKGSSATRLLRKSRLAQHANTQRYLVAAPNLTEASFSHQPQQLEFLEKVIAKTMNLHAVDPTQIYLTGFAAGGQLALKFSQTTDHHIKGVASVLGYPPREIAGRPVRAVSTLFIFGGDDPQISTKAKKNKLTPKLASKFWAKRFSCSTTVSAQIEFLKQTGRYACDDDISVIYLEIGDHGHYWPRAIKPEDYAVTTKSNGPFQRRFDATSSILEFFGNIGKAK